MTPCGRSPPPPAPRRRTASPYSRRRAPARARPVRGQCGSSTIKTSSTRRQQTRQRRRIGDARRRRRDGVCYRHVNHLRHEISDGPGSPATRIWGQAVSGLVPTSSSCAAPREYQSAPCRRAARRVADAAPTRAAPRLNARA